jgi:hypothetical protein
VTEAPTGDRAEVAARIRAESPGYATYGSALYGALAARVADDIDAGGASWDVLRGLKPTREPTYVALHLFGAVHRLVLEGSAPDVARHLPSSGGDGDAEGAWLAIRDLLADRTDEVRTYAERPVQTNEPGRAAALMGGFLLVAQRTGLPLRLLEVGASAGLNLRWDHFRYEAGDGGWGDPGSPLRIRNAFEGPTPPLDVVPTVAERSGCDANPVDPTTEDGRLTLMSYVWPDQITRFEQLKAAIEVARSVPATVVRADAVDWLGEVLAEPGPRVATVVYHSVFLPYLSPAKLRDLRAVMTAAAARATLDAPFAELSLEPEDPDAIPPTFEIRLEVWPDGGSQRIALAAPHGPPVRWLA